jgi:hypothetical protein
MLNVGAEEITLSRPLERAVDSIASIELLIALDTHSIRF